MHGNLYQILSVKFFNNFRIHRQNKNYLWKIIGDFRFPQLSHLAALFHFASLSPIHKYWLICVLLFFSLASRIITENAGVRCIGPWIRDYSSHVARNSVRVLSIGGKNGVAERPVNAAAAASEPSGISVSLLPHAGWQGRRDVNGAGTPCRVERGKMGQWVKTGQ